MLAATLGQVLLAWLGSLVRDRLTWRPARVLDAGVGALVSVLAMLLVTWFLAVALRPGPLPGAVAADQRLQVITAVDQVMPDEARTLFSSFRRVLDDSGLPAVFGGLSPERIRPVDPPAPGIAGTPASAARDQRREGHRHRAGRAAAARGQRVRLLAAARDDQRARRRRGRRDPAVQIGGTGGRYGARVVVFDPERDLAVLPCPDLPAARARLRRRAPTAATRPWSRASPAAGPTGSRRPGSATRSTPAARTSTTAAQVTREVFSLYADVEPGNSGGPLLSPDGGVYGVIFAKSLDDADTGYALTIDEVAARRAAGGTASDQVDTGDCA